MGASTERFEFGLIKFEVELKASALEELKKLPRKDQLRISGVITILSVNPLPPASFKLTGRDGYQIRIGDYRLIYTVNASKLIVLVIKIGHREDVYR